MWKNALKFLAILLLKNRMEFIKSHFFNKLNSHSGEDLSRLKQNIAVMAESRAALFKQNFNHEVQRLVNSLLGYMLILLAAMLSLLTGLMWLFASAWNSVNRDLILGATMLLPLLIAIGIFIAIRFSWKKQPLFAKSMVQIESDWQVFRNGLDGTADTSDEANR